MIPAILALIFGLALLVWSADRFVEGAAATAGYFGMPPLLIGVVIVGFGTSAPEMVVSALSAFDGGPAFEGKPYKTSGSKMIYNPTLKREIQEGWEECSIGNKFKTADL